MNHAAAAVSTAVAFGWLGMVSAISFLEAPLEFRAPGVSVQVVLAGEIGARSRAHHAYLALECAKVISLLTLGVLLLDN